MDAAVIRFTTKLFDVTKERPNDINAIYGVSLLLWLADKDDEEIRIGGRLEVEFRRRRRRALSARAL